MKKELYIYGAGGMARETYYLIKRDHKKYIVKGFIDDYVKIGTNVIDNVYVVGDCEFLLSIKRKINIVIAVANSVVRCNIFKKLKEKENIVFPSIISKTAVSSKFNEIAQGCIICDYCILTVNVKLGAFSIINYDCTIGHETKLGEFTTLYPSVNLSGNVTIEEKTEIGTGTNVIQGLKIGSNTIIGAGAVVIKNIPSRCTAVGVPAKPIKFY